MYLMICLGVFLFFFFISSFLILFSKKLVTLLSLEGLMLSCILMYSERLGQVLFCLGLFYISIIMVVDSVFGLSLFIHNSRGTSISSNSFLSV